MFDLRGKISIITGGNGGIGKGIALGLAKHGSDIAVIARNKEKSESACEEIRKMGVRAQSIICDVSERKSVNDAVIETNSIFGKIDILVNNAGMNIRTDEPQDLTTEKWDQIIQTNLSSMHYMSSEVFPYFKLQKAGKIINIGSMTSIFGSPYASAYAASKGGVVQYTKSCALGWGLYNIQVNAILPGYIVTEMTKGFLEKYPEKEQVITDRTAMGRWGQPQDLSGTAVFLASQASDFVTGTFIPVDGGYSVALN